MTTSWLLALEIRYTSSRLNCTSPSLQAYTESEELKHCHATGSITRASAVLMERWLSGTGFVVPASTGLSRLRSQMSSKPSRKQPAPMPNGYWMAMPPQLSGHPEVLSASGVELKAVNATSSKYGCKINIVGITLLLFLTNQLRFSGLLNSSRNHHLITPDKGIIRSHQRVV